MSILIMFPTSMLNINRLLFFFFFDKASQCGPCLASICHIAKNGLEFLTVILLQSPTVKTAGMCHHTRHLTLAQRQLSRKKIKGAINLAGFSALVKSKRYNNNPQPRSTLKTLRNFNTNLGKAINCLLPLWI